MGKKSLIKSTSKKKKAASKKKDDDKKTSVPETAKKVAPGKKAAAKKSAPEKPTAQKKAAPKTDSASKELLFRKFEKEAPAELFKIEPAKGDFAAPPLISTTDKMETERLKAILFRKFDLAEPSEEKPTVEKSTEPAGKKEVSAAEKKTEKPVEKKKVEKPDPREVIARKFFQAPPADSLFVPQTRKEAVPSAPPLISAADDEEAAWLKKLLFRQIDLTTPVEKRKPAPEAEPETPAEAKAKEKIEEPAEEAAPVPEEAKEPPDPREVIARKFFQAPPADSLFVPQTRKEAVPSAPPLISAADDEEAAWLKKLLFRQIDLTTPVEKRKPAPEAESTAEPLKEAPVEPEKEEKIETPAEEPETVAQAPEAAAPEEGEPMKTPEVVELEKAEAPEESPKVTVSYDEPPPTDREVSDPMEKMIKYAAAGFILVLLLIIGYSFDNRANYYIHPNDDGIEILRGIFAPLGKEVVAELEGVPAPEVVKEVYAAEEVLPLAFEYYVDRADRLMSINGLPDLQNIQVTLDKALDFATTKEQTASVYSRMDSLEALVLQYKATVAAQRGTSWDVAAAIGILQEALQLNTNENEKNIIQSRINYLREYRDELEVREAEAKAAAAAAEIQPTEREALEAPAAEEAVPAVEEALPAAEEKAEEKEVEAGKSDNH